MLPYLLVLGFLMLWIVLEKEAINRTSFWVPLVVLVLFASIRSYKVGTDTFEYTRFFRSNRSVENFHFLDNEEYGFQLLEYLILHFTHNYFWLFAISTLFIVLCFLLIIRRYSVDYTISIFVFITLGFYAFSFNGLRQGIAIAIMALATPYLLQKKFIPYLLIALAASLIHKSALFLIPFYFLINLSLNHYYKIVLSFLTSLLCSPFLVQYISTRNERYEGYAQVSENSGGLLILSFHTTLMLLLNVFSYLYRVQDETFRKLLTFYSVGVVFIIPISLLGSNPSGPQRLLSYFTWSLILLLPFALRRMNQLLVYLAVYTVSILYFIMTTSAFSHLTPYTLNPIFKVLS